MVNIRSQNIGDDYENLSEVFVIDNSFECFDILNRLLCLVIEVISILIKRRKVAKSAQKIKCRFMISVVSTHKYHVYAIGR